MFCSQTAIGQHSKKTIKKVLEPTNGNQDVTVDEGVWFLEGGANYLRNIYGGQEFFEVHEHQISVGLTSAGLIDGQQLLASFNELIESEIKPYEIANGWKAHLINGYILSNDGNTAVVGFDVSYGEPWPPGPLPQYNYPNTDQPFCDAASFLETGINSDLQLNNSFAVGVSTSTLSCGDPLATCFPTVLEGPPTNSTPARIWKSPPGVTMFLASDFQQYHDGGKIAAQYFLNQLCNPTNDPNVVCPTLLEIKMVCNFSFGSANVCSHYLVDYKSSQYVASY